MDTNIVTAEDFPHGLRCMDCDEIIESGQTYSTRLTGIHSNQIVIEGKPEDVFLTELTCVPCGLRSANDASG